MKKLLFIFGLFCMVSCFSSCGSTSQEKNVNDSIDSTSVDTLSVDTVDSIK